MPHFQFSCFPKERDILHPPLLPRSPTLLREPPGTTLPFYGVCFHLAILWLEKGSLLSDRQMHESAENMWKREAWSHPSLSTEVVVFVNIMEIVISAHPTLPQNTKELSLNNDNTVTLNIFTFCKLQGNASAAFTQKHVHHVEGHTFNSVVK